MRWNQLRAELGLRRLQFAQCSIVRPVRYAVFKGNPAFQGTTEIVCQQIPRPFTVLRNGRPFSNWTLTGTTLVIRTDVDRQHVFEATNTTTSDSARRSAK